MKKIGYAAARSGSFIIGACYFLLGQFGPPAFATSNVILENPEIQQACIKTYKERLDSRFLEFGVIDNLRKLAGCGTNDPKVRNILVEHMLQATGSRIKEETLTLLRPLAKDYADVRAAFIAQLDPIDPDLSWAACPMEALEILYPLAGDRAIKSAITSACFFKPADRSRTFRALHVLVGLYPSHPELAMIFKDALIAELPLSAEALAPLCARPEVSKALAMARAFETLQSCK